jgi:hypothetical protein
MTLAVIEKPCHLEVQRFTMPPLSLSSDASAAVSRVTVHAPPIQSWQRMQLTALTPAQAAKYTLEPQSCQTRLTRLTAATLVTLQTVEARFPGRESPLPSVPRFISRSLRRARLV